MQKSSLLKVISIFFIIFGALSLLSSLGKFTENAAYGGIGIGTSVFALAAAALELAAGILGVQNKDNLDVCKTLAIVLIVLAVINGLLSILLVTTLVGVMGGSAGLGVAAGVLTGVIVMVFALLLPVLYMIGIKKSRA
ncbi:hypothetical protein H9X87_08960 [Pseudoflavonifractor capillosus]|uniref:hypothetical protein n=1 Tax=Pseudoflavonifractor capillosus TaxID=106588 RepID=UPI00195DF29D|nr:hypothetical protein [Pseudoflavonifractor capillosus]MBM6694885.1 hypothetical protein [Pseudoflavonifractor capillosus]